jgi:pilus assembly protein Flp/PilA
MIEILRTMVGAHLPKTGDRGASAVEYGLLVAGIAALIVLVVFTLGGTVKGAFTNTNSCISASTAATC